MLIALWSTITHYGSPNGALSPGLAWCKCLTTSTVDLKSNLYTRMFIENTQASSENLRFLVRILNLLITYNVIITIPAASVSYEDMDIYT